MSRNLYAAWIEYDNPKDGVAFLRSMKTLGIDNLLNHMKERTLFPGIRDPRVSKRKWFKTRLVDMNHPWLPIYSIGGQIMICPNEKKEGYYNNEPLYKYYRDVYGEEKFKVLIEEQNEFLSKWVFSPGINVNSTSSLNVGDDNQLSAKFMGISGHGVNMTISGGGSGARIRQQLAWVQQGGSGRPSPYYIFIATCNNLHEGLANDWLEIFRQDNPVRGILGFETRYPDARTGVGEAIFSSFCNLLQLKDRKTKKPYTVIRAWEDANLKATQYTWGAVIHKDAIDDSLGILYQNQLKSLSSDGDIFYFRKVGEPYPHIEKIPVKEMPRRLDVSFVINNTVIDSSNNSRIRLEPGKKISIRVRAELVDLNRSVKDEFISGDRVKLIFNRFRCDKPGMDLRKLIVTNDIDGKTIVLLPNQRLKYHCDPSSDTGSIDGNSEDSYDAILYICQSNCKEFEIPLTIRNDACKSFPFESDELGHGFFWILAIMDIWGNKPYHGYFSFSDGSIPFVRTGVFLNPKS
jgi:hypothetical protein